MIEIKNLNGVVIFKDDGAKTIREALVREDLLI